MNKLVTAVALATLIASPALAQSYDPHLGSGNIVRPIPAQAGHLARPVVSAGALPSLCFGEAGCTAFQDGAHVVRAGQEEPSALLAEFHATDRTL
jgi:hypothetical protein